MTINLPYKVRATIYIANVLGSPVVAYLFDKGIIDTGLVSLWAAEVAAAFLLAGLNVTKTD